MAIIPVLLSVWVVLMVAPPVLCIGEIALDAYKTIQKDAVSEYVDRHSRFIGYARPIETEEDAITYLNEIKAKHWDARHNVYAYSLLKDNIMRYSDDGEPHGTAGIPVLDILKKGEITNTIVVVTRYFGGILLGTGGLVRAYSSAAKLAIDSANIINMVLCFKLQILCDYSMYGKVSSIAMDMNAKIEESEFLDKVKMVFYLPKDKLILLDKKLSDISAGAIKAEVLGEKYVALT